MAESDNVELVRRLYELHERGEIETMMSYLAQDVEWVEPPEAPDPQSSVGADAARKSHDQWMSTWGEVGVDVLDLVSAGDLVMAHVRLKVEGAGSGVHVSSEQFQIVTLRDGKIARFQMFYDEKSAREAAGLDQPNNDTTEADPT